MPYHEFNHSSYETEQTSDLPRKMKYHSSERKNQMDGYTKGKQECSSQGEDFTYNGWSTKHRLLLSQYRNHLEGRQVASDEALEKGPKLLERYNKEFQLEQKHKEKEKSAASSSAPKKMSTLQQMR